MTKSTSKLELVTELSFLYTARATTLATEEVLRTLKSYMDTPKNSRTAKALEAQAVSKLIEVQSSFLTIIQDRINTKRNAPKP